MKNNFIKQTTVYIGALALIIGQVSCSKLDEKVFGSKSIVASTGGGASSANLASVYEATNALVGQ